jgi:TPR repeat protein
MIRLSLLIILMSFQTAYAPNIRYWNEKQKEADSLYLQGKYSEALDIYRYVAEETASKYSQFKVAWIYGNGLGIKQDCKEAARWYTLAANSGSEAAQNNLYVLYSNGCPDFSPNKNLAVHYLKMAADSGNSRAQSNLAYLYSVGELVENNPYLAYDLAQRSAQQNDITGVLRLAKFYMEGIGVPADPTRAYDLLTNASTMDIEKWDAHSKQEAQYLLAICFLEGKGTPKNPVSAYKWFLLSQSGPDAEISEASNEIVENLEEALSDTDKQKASQLASSIDNKTPSASQNDLLLSLYQFLEKDKQREAVELARILSSQKNTRGQLILGLMYRDGYGSIPKDLDEAYILFKRSCKSGEWESCAYQVDALIKMNRSSAANTLLGNIAAKVPETDDAKLLLAELYLSLGKVNIAESITRKVLVGDPINEKAKSLLSVIMKNTTGSN